MQLLRMGWPRAKVHQHQTSIARMLTEEGMTFQLAGATQEIEVVNLIRRDVPNMGAWAPDPADCLVVAQDGDERVAGGMLLSATFFDTGLQVAIRAVAVEPEFRHKGVGTVLLSVVDEIIMRASSHPIGAIIGTCPPAIARFYQRSGYTVLAPGEVLPHYLAAAPTDLKSSSEATPCYFVRGF